MSTVAEAYGLNQEQWEQREAARERLQRAYQALFDGEPTREDQRLVRQDLEAFCGMYRPMMGEGDEFADVAFKSGMFRVWQRIHSFRFPRPADASRGQNDRTDTGPKRHVPIPGGGVAEPTDD